MVSVRCRKSSQISPDHAAPSRAHCSGLSRVAQAERRTCPSGGFRDLRKVMSWTLPAGTQPGQVKTAPVLMGRALLMCQGSRLNGRERLDAGRRCWTTLQCHILAAIRPMPRRLYLESFATVLLDDGAETCKNEGWGPCAVMQASTSVRSMGRAVLPARNYRWPKSNERLFARLVTSPGPFVSATRGECQLDSVAEVRPSCSPRTCSITLAPFILPRPLYGCVS